MTSKELKWCNNFRRAMHYRWKGKNRRVRKKNRIFFREGCNFLRKGRNFPRPEPVYTSETT